MNKHHASCPGLRCATTTAALLAALAAGLGVGPDRLIDPLADGQPGRLRCPPCDIAGRLVDALDAPRRSLPRHAGSSIAW